LGPIQLFMIFEYLLKRSIYKEGMFLSKKMWLSAAVLLTVEEYGSLPTTQTTNRVPQNCWNYLTSAY